MFFQGRPVTAVFCMWALSNLYCESDRILADQITGLPGQCLCLLCLVFTAVHCL
jgi:hypothetical protein